MNYGKMFVLVLVLCVVVVTHAQELTVSGRVQRIPRSKNADSASVVVWLIPIDTAPSTSGVEHRHYRLAQKDKHFEPHLTVVPVGTAVEFPNLDPWFHNVFSLFDGKRFDLGLYEAGTTRTVRFDRAGISYIFCNIHPEMSAVVVAVPTPYYSVSNKRGEVNILNVPPGRYTIHFWSDTATQDELNALTRSLDISEAKRSFGSVQVPNHDHSDLTHKNKYGTDYDPPSPSSPIYAH